VRCLAFDVGDRRVGLALSDPSGVIASPLTVIERRSKAEDFGRIARLVRQHEAGCLVVGHPLRADGSSGPQARKVERYVAALTESLQADGLEADVVFWDEHSSTQMAQDAMISSGRRRKHRHARLDAVAAAVILQDYLDAQRTLHEVPKEGEHP
jgi:putative Holliday junction resolvase